MHKSCVFFKISDLTFHFPRNYKRFPDVKIEKNISYNDNYGDYTKGDILYAPQKKNGKYPVFVNVHGGGFVKGDKKHRTTFCSMLANEGWFVFNINYRLAPQYALPAGIVDTISALNYLKNFQEKYDLDLEKVVISGDSAGAYYATAAVAAINDENMRKSLDLPVSNQNIKALASFCGPFDMMKILKMKTPLNMSKDIGDCLLGIKIKKDYSNLNEFGDIDAISPINFVNNKWPLTYLLIAENDSFCQGQGELLEEKLLENKIEIVKYFAKGEMHCFHLLPYKKSSKDCYKDFKNFLKTIKEN